MRNFQLPGRSPVHGTNGMVATSQPLATAAGLEMLRQGGNAVDAAIAASAVLAVVQPTSTGVGGDCFAFYAPGSGGKIVAYNGSGRAPAAAIPQWYSERGIRQIDVPSAHAVTIPGAIDAWDQLLGDYGTKGLDEVLQPAISAARDGFPVHSQMASAWAKRIDILRRDPEAARIFLPGGKAPGVGTIHRQPELATTLAAIARDGRDAFYKGWIAEDLVAHLRSHGGLHTLDDFAEAKGEYVTPISTGYKGYTVYECPPNSQGIVALEMLNILSGFKVPGGGPLSTERMHLLIEAAWLAYADRDRYVCDPGSNSVPMDLLLSQAHADQMRAKIRPDRAMHAAGPSGLPPHNDTIYLTVVDRDGNAISFINSLFASFGTGLCGPKSGVLLQNRGCGFVVDAEHPNCIGPRKRPMHTIIPGMLAKNDRPVMPFGVLGGHYQATGHVFLLGNILEYGLDLQEAIDLARVYPTQLARNEVQVECGVPEKTVTSLKALGHNIVPAPDPVGGGQAIWIDWDSGVYTAGSDPRYDGCAMGY